MRCIRAYVWSFPKVAYVLAAGLVHELMHGEGVFCGLLSERAPPLAMRCFSFESTTV